MDNYFQYFSEIEQRYLARRGSPLLLSTLDWALIETWKSAGIPLAAVLRGIDESFDSWDKKPPRGKVKRINSLTYCSQSVLEAAQQMADAATGAVQESNAKAQHESGLEPERVGKYLLENAKIVETQCKKLPQAAQNIAADSAKSLRELSETAPGKLPLEELERHLTVLEEKLMAALLAATPDVELIAVRAQADREMAPHKRRMSAAQIEQLQRQYVQRRLLEQAGLPRLSLFYLV